MAGRAVKYLEIWWLWGRVDNATNADYATAGALNLSASFTT